MNHEQLFRTERVLAGFLAIVGQIWAFFLLLTLISPPVGLLVNLMFLPGWLVFFGWWKILANHRVGIKRRTFWWLSFFVNAGYLLLTICQKGPLTNFERWLIGWLIGATLISLISVRLTGIRGKIERSAKLC